MTPQVFISGMHIADDGTLVVHADEMADAGVKSIEFIEGTPEARIEELTAQLAEYDHACKTLGIQKDVLAYIDGLKTSYEMALEAAEADAKGARAEVDRRRADVEAIVEEVNKYKSATWATMRTTLGAAAQRISLGIAEALQARWKEDEAALAAEQAAFTFELVAHLARQRAFSLRTFGPGNRAAGVVNHIRKELKEIEAEPHDLKEWIDVAILAFDGAWRTGAEPEEIARAFEAKQATNEGRQWPDWRTADPDKAIEHVRAEQADGEKGEE